MASLIDTADLTLNEQEALTASEAIFEKVYNKPLLNAAHSVQTGIQMKTQIPFFGLMGLVGKVSSGCTPNASAEKVNLTEKYWDPALVDYRLTHCQGDIAQLYKMWKRSRIALKTWEEVDNEQMAFITDRGVDATTEAILRITSFGDKTAAHYADGGMMTEGTDVAFFTMINGLWQQILADAAIKRYTIPENALASYVAQAALDSSRALNVLRYLYNNIDSRAFTAKDLAYQMTRSLWNNWCDYLEDKSLSFTLSEVENSDGTTKAKYRGIPIVVRDDWSRNIAAYHNNGTVNTYPHRAILTSVSNIPIGTSDEQSMKSLDSFYDKVTRQWYLDSAFYIDCKVLSAYMIAVAY